MINRKEGVYWCKVSGNDDWVIVEWAGGKWVVGPIDCQDDVIEVKCRIPEPDERNENNEGDSSMTTRREIRQEEEIAALKKENARLMIKIRLANQALHNTVLSNQAAYIEWKNGRGSESAMMWIQNGLSPAGLVPDDRAEHGKSAQSWYDAYLIT